MNNASDPRIRSSRWGALFFTCCSMLLAGATGWLVWRLLTAGGYGNEPTRQVVVAGRAVVAGRPLQPEDLKHVSWPVSAQMVGMFADTEPLLLPVPRVSTTGLVQGEPILRERLATPEAGPGLAALITPSTRAVAIKIDRDVAAARLLYPGAHVDVLATLQDRNHAVTTRIILEDARVIAVGNFADSDAARRGIEPASSGPPALGGAGRESEAVVTVEVSPKDAERLSLAAREGKIDLALRSATDHATTVTHGVTMSDLLRREPDETPVPKLPERPKKRAARTKIKVFHEPSP